MLSIGQRPECERGVESLARWHLPDLEPAPQLPRPPVGRRTDAETDRPRTLRTPAVRLRSKQSVLARQTGQSGAGKNSARREPFPTRANCALAASSHAACACEQKHGPDRAACRLIAARYKRQRRACAPGGEGLACRASRGEARDGGHHGVHRKGLHCVSASVMNGVHRH